MATVTLGDLQTDLAEFLRDPNNRSYATADLTRYLNRAAKEVARACIIPAEQRSPSRGLIEEEEMITLVADQYLYPLPADTIDVIFVTHFRGGTDYRELKPRSLRGLFDGFVPAFTSSWLSHYQVFGDEPKVITRGVASGGSSTTLIDAARSGDAAYRFDTGTALTDENGNAMATNDIIKNLTDGSKGTITALTSQTTLTCSGGFGGGSRNVFEEGDRYEIVAKDASRPMLMVSPVPSQTDETTLLEIATTTSVPNTTELGIGNVAGVNQKVSQSFTLERSATLTGIGIDLGDSTGTPLGGMTLRVETNSAGVPSGTLVHALAKAALASGSAGATNRFTFQDKLNLAVATLYHATVQIPAQSGYYASPNNNYYTWKATTASVYSLGQAGTHDGSSWTGDSAKDCLMTLYQAVGAERLVVRRARYPRALSASGDILEFPDWARMAVLKRAHYWASLKTYQVSDNVPRVLQAEYNQEISTCRALLTQDSKAADTRIKNALWRMGGRGAGSVIRTDEGRFDFPIRFVD